MTSLSFPDVNVWLSLASVEHVHGTVVRRWWSVEESPIAFARFSQIALLRLLTTAAAMDGQPVTMREAWRIHDAFYRDDRVCFVPEAGDVDGLFRRMTRGAAASPKTWADAWMLATAEAAGGCLVTLDRALAPRGARCLLD